MNKNERVNLVKQILEEEGFCANINNEGDIVFKFEYLPYKVVLDEDDDEFIRLLYENCGKVEDAAHHLRLLAGALHATAETKVAQVSVSEGVVEASVELFFGSPEHFRPVIRRSLNALRSAVTKFEDFTTERHSAIL